jgi:hypothetical protein
MPSKVIHHFEYRAESAELEIRFTTGRRYVYYMVSASVAADMGRASSKGEFFNTEIRDRFPFRRLE